MEEKSHKKEIREFTLKIIGYDKVKIDESTEITFKEFIEWIENSIKEYEIDISDTANLQVIYAREVYQLDDNNFKIIINGKDVYYIDTKYKTYLTENLYKLSQITKYNNKEFEKYKKICNGEDNFGEYTYQDISSILEFLKIHKELCNSKIRDKIISLASYILPLFLILASFWFLSYFDFYAVYELLGPVILFDTAIIVGTIVYSSSASNKTNTCNLLSLIIILLEKKQLNIKEKQLRKQHTLDSQIHAKIEKENKKDPKDEAIEGYIRNIIKASEKLNKEDASNILYELRKIVDDYKTKCMQKPIEQEGLTLEGDYKRSLARETIEQINDLEMEVAELLNKEKQEDLTFDVGDKLLEEIDAKIASNQEENILMTSNGQKISGSSKKR